MMYPYLTLADGTEIVHSGLMKCGEKTCVEVHFERPKWEGFDSARCVLPDYQWLFNNGFSAEEIQFFEEFLHHNAHLLFKYAETGGIQIA